MKRRAFLTAVGRGVAGAGLLTASGCGGEKNDVASIGKKMVGVPVLSGTGPMTKRLGPHGDVVSLLGYGMMRLPTVDGKHANGWAKGVSSAPIDQALVNRQIDYALEHGVNYFDTSPAYCRGESEAVLGRALARHPRNRYFVATKLSNFARSTWSQEGAKAMYQASFKKLGVSVIDYYLLHSIGMTGYADFESRFIKNGMIDFLVEERRKGTIRNLGFSFHGDPRTWDWMMANHERYHWDFVQIQLNYVDWWTHSEKAADRYLDASWLYGQLAERKIPAVVMEPLLGGRLAQFSYAAAEHLAPLDPGATPAKWAMRFAGDPPGILTVLSGMTYLPHLQENIATFSPLRSLSSAERLALKNAATATLKDKTVPCNKCQYCMPCPYGLDIPTILTTYNRMLTMRQTPRAFLAAYDRAVLPLRRADHCTGCRKCAPHCPQGIDIPKRLWEIDAQIEAFRQALPQM